MYSACNYQAVGPVTFVMRKFQKFEPLIFVEWKAPDFSTSSVISKYKYLTSIGLPIILILHLTPFSSCLSPMAPSCFLTLLTPLQIIPIQSPLCSLLLYKREIHLLYNAMAALSLLGRADKT